jgi:AcrR family transcriptional regulator
MPLKLNVAVHPSDSHPGPKRRASRIAPEERQEEILKAALDIFAEKGFAATRLEDVAHRAGVAKGTLYLYFSDKEALFESMLRSVAAPVLARLSDLAGNKTLTPAQAIEAFMSFFESEVIGTPREKVLRLIIAEGPRFPAMAKFYYDNVVAKGLSYIQAILKRDGPNEEQFGVLTRFPQLVFAPLLMSVVWRSLFDDFERLDVGSLLSAYREILIPNEGETRS